MKCHWILCVALFVPGLAGADENDLVPVKKVVDQAKTEINEIDVAELAAMQEKGAIVIDVREADETKRGIIPGAEIVPRGMLEFRVGGITEDPDQPVVVYCRSGNRSALAALSLQNMGYRQVYSLAGGWKAWEEARQLEALSPRDPDNR
jgi:rhodanese-related sulfurtransferase